MDFLIGSASARIDEKGRLKVPTAFRTWIQENYGQDVFVTSIKGDRVQIYPMKVWTEFQRQLLGESAKVNPSVVNFLSRVNYFGQATEIDAQGRVVIQPRLRERAQMVGEVDVLGNYNYLEVWNHDRFEQGLDEHPFTDDDARAVAAFRP